MTITYIFLGILGLFIIKYLGCLYFAMSPQLIMALPFDSTHCTLSQKMERGYCWETVHFPESLGAENQLAYLARIYQELVQH